MYGFIYITTNLIDGKKYIGQKIYNSRWKTYLGSGVILQRAIKKYGRESFKREIIEECENKNQLDEREIYWISYYRATESDNFYNISSGGDGGNTIRGYSYEQKQELSKKLSDIRKGIVNLGNKNGNAKKVICLNTMEVFDTIVMASEKYNISKDAIQQCCSDKSVAKTAGWYDYTNERFIWEYYEDGKIYKYEPFQRKKSEKGKKVYCITTKESFNNILTASDKYKINSSSISGCCKGKLKSAGKHPQTKERMIWIYYDDYLNNKNIVKEKIKNSVCKTGGAKTIKVKCINTNVIFNSIKSASEWCNLKVGSNITEVCNNKRKHAGKHPITGEKLAWEYVS